MKSTDHYLIINDQQHGPYTFKQIRSMWLAGQVTGEVSLLVPGNAPTLLKTLAAQLEAEKKTSGNNLLALLLGLCGVALGALFVLGGVLGLLAAKSAMHETNSSILLAGGAILGILAPLLAICARKH
jgi:hypothetical protein